jgi:superfamily II DNA or RNA helicase
LREFPKGIKFKFGWRAYQQRVLDELETHLGDDHLHIVAPPGSGKTVLGIEVALRLNKPTLIISPTLAIRNQWIQRLCELFLETTTVPQWVSRDIRQPQFLTVVTYQGLHAACSAATTSAETEPAEDDQEESDESNTSTPPMPSSALTRQVILRLQQRGVGTIIADEAHHLRNEWWKSLMQIKEALNATIVGLTATPPYDVSPQEWVRYVQLNGPVDSEIPVPELVRAGDLCPHQDYVLFSLPTAEEETRLIEFRERVRNLFAELKSDPQLVSAFQQHPMYVDSEQHLEWIYSHLPYYSAMLIFLHACGREVTKTHLGIIGDSRLNIPDLDYHWMETLLTFYLYKDQENFKQFERHRETLEKKLRRLGVLERRQIRLEHNSRIFKSLRSSASKFNSVSRIVDFEFRTLGHGLRMVILTDFIRSEFLAGH